MKIIMLQVFRAVLLLMVIIVSATQGNVCTNLSKNRVSVFIFFAIYMYIGGTNFQNMCSNSKWQSDINITNESSTSVLVQWRHYTMNNNMSAKENDRQGRLAKRQSENEVKYNITYVRTDLSGSNDASQKTVSCYNFN